MNRPHEPAPFVPTPLAPFEVSGDETAIVEALAWRAQKTGCKEVEDACVIVLSALQGHYDPPKTTSP